MLTVEYREANRSVVLSLMKWEEVVVKLISKESHSTIRQILNTIKILYSFLVR